jgi:hypothetical protein
MELSTEFKLWQAEDQSHSQVVFEYASVWGANDVKFSWEWSQWTYINYHGEMYTLHGVGH